MSICPTTVSRSTLYKVPSTVVTCLTGIHNLGPGAVSIIQPILNEARIGKLLQVGVGETIASTRDWGCGTGMLAR
jgi:hypothetical protein